ncbi:hypothetical protein LFYK43_20460 [Ligilactobacillus salitolerans]|uniref:Uncharacterized protein n=1 Tax=Ligilactobacillus salitolerans TaxID=1808352 RepID=A0A401IVS2_9LACO|nr:hypothetical protein [Ligilactobacillus salitolerans]GBG95587.1 hypothetical protein LFYK43_20460 [Ligilactobacillus salitolerans]
MNNDEKTVIFQPDGTTTNIETAKAISTTARLLHFNDQLKDSLQNGIGFTQLLDTLINTDDPQELEEATLRLINYQLDSSFLVFPQQYSQADFYLIFLSRLLQQHDNEQLILQSSQQKHELYHEFPGLNAEGYFVFEVDQANENGAYYVEKQTNNRLFYLNFSRHILRINAAAVTSLLVVNYQEKFKYPVVRKFALLLIKIASLFKEDFGYDVDFNILDQSNSTYYRIIKPEMPVQALDKLFVAASKAGYMLEAGVNGEALLELTSDLVVTFGPETLSGDGSQDEWGINVKDKNEELSWFDLLFQYDFIREWYLNNLNILEIKVDPRYFD